MEDYNSSIIGQKFKLQRRGEDSNLNMMFEMECQEGFADPYSSDTYEFGSLADIGDPDEPLLMWIPTDNLLWEDSNKGPIIEESQYFVFEQSQVPVYNYLNEKPPRGCVRITSIEHELPVFIDTTSPYYSYANTDNSNWQARDEFTIVQHINDDEYYIENSSPSNWQCRSDGQLWSLGGTGTWATYKIFKCPDSKPMQNCWIFYNEYWDLYIEALNDGNGQLLDCNSGIIDSKTAQFAIFPCNGTTPHPSESPTFSPTASTVPNAQVKITKNKKDNKAILIVVIIAGILFLFTVIGVSVLYYRKTNKGTHSIDNEFTNNSKKSALATSVDPYQVEEDSVELPPYNDENN